MKIVAVVKRAQFGVVHPRDPEQTTAPAFPDGELTARCFDPDFVAVTYWTGLRHLLKSSLVAARVLSVELITVPTDHDRYPIRRPLSQLGINRRKFYAEQERP